MIEDPVVNLGAQPRIPSKNSLSGQADHSLWQNQFVFQPIRQWSESKPDSVAAIYWRHAYTYRDLEERTNQMARALRHRGVRRGDLVVLLFPRGIDVLFAIVAVMKAGAAYVPIDPETPQERIQHCIEDAEARLVLFSDEIAIDGITDGESALALRHLRGEAEMLSVTSLTEVSEALEASDRAYAIFTSGTTGRPKGVPITHAGLSNFVWGDQLECIRVEPEDRVFQGFSPASDGYHEEVWPTFVAGATLVIASTDDIHSGQGLGQFLNEHRVSIISCAPTLLSMVEDDVPTLRRVLFGAERLPPEMLRRWWKPTREVINTYGPTEATVGITFALCQPDRPVIIGQPLPNYFCHVLNPEMEAVPEGEEGELCVSGVGVSPGYLATTRTGGDRFLPNPFFRPEDQNPTLYRTGDRVRVNAEGDLEWLGRIDSQVKIRGHRIELSDIESQMGRHPAIQTVVVVAKHDDAGDTRLVALLALNSREPFDLASYLQEVYDSLPAYMIPQTLLQVDQIPRLPSGKVDRRACTGLHGVTLRIERELVPPSTPTEARVFGVWQDMFPDAEISCTDDFFRDLGGYSLLASRFVSVLRTQYDIRSVSVLDIYENPTLRGFASVIDSRIQGTNAQESFEAIRPGAFGIACVAQTLGILILFALQALLWLGPLVATIYYSDNGYDDFRSLLLGLTLHAITVPLMFAIAIATKWLVGGRFKEGSYPLWGPTFLRWWFVHRVFAITPVVYLTGTPLAAVYLRLLGAKVGANSTFESLEMDCPDLIEIGDDCVMETSAWLHPSEISGGQLHLRKIKIGNGCTMGVRSGVCGGATLGDGADLRDLTCTFTGTHVPAGEEWHGSPAVKAPERTLPAYNPALNPPKPRLFWYGFAQTGLVFLLTLMESVPFLSVAWVLYNRSEVWHQYWVEPVFAIGIVAFATVQALSVKWAIMGRLRPGTYAQPGWTWLRMWFTDKHLELMSSILVPVYDSLFARSLCIALGMKCGPRCEIALPRRMPYDLVEMGEESFIASEVSVGRPIRRNGTMMLETTKIGRRTFLGNDSVVPQGCVVPDESLLGVLSVCPSTSVTGSAPNQAWLGSPAFSLPSRDVDTQFEPEKTYAPSRKLYIKRVLHESLRIVLPSMFSLLIAIFIIESFVWVWNESELWIACLASPIIYAVGSVFAALMCWIAKMALVGRYRPTVKPLWSRFVWNTETYSAILHDFAAPLFIGCLEGSFMMPLFMRFLGANIGKRVFINTTDFTETDMITLGDDVAINAHAPMQAHLFEDRVIKVGPIKIGDRSTVGNYSVILCGSELKHDVYVGPISLIMKGETIPAHTSWLGSPARISQRPGPVIAASSDAK